MKFKLLMTLVLTVFAAVGCSDDKDAPSAYVSYASESKHRKVEQIGQEEASSLFLLKEGEQLATGEILLEKIELASGLYHLVLDDKKIVGTVAGSIVTLASEELFAWEQVEGGWLLTFADNKTVQLK